MTEKKLSNKKLTRRRLLHLTALAGTGTMIVACAPVQPAAPAAPTSPAATETPKAEVAQPTEAPKAGEAKPTEAPATAPSAPLAEVPRNRTLVLGWNPDGIDVSNPWATGYTHQAGNALMWEPLFYNAVFGGKEYPWLAESGEYNKDFTELTIKLRKGAEWSDGTPVTAKDVLFTLNGQLKNDKLPYNAPFVQFVKEITSPDDSTVVITFNQPAPRFKFEVLSQKFDTGIPIVPAHVLEKETDVTAFKGGMDMPHSGPYKLVSWTADQKIYDLREDWWAAKTGFQPLPEVKRIIISKIGTDMGTVAQRAVNNELDASLVLTGPLIKSAIEQNPKITTHSGNKPPYGYLDWWPNSLWVNTKLEPFNSADVRRAISLAINRDQIDEVVYEGAKIGTIWPFPLYPGLLKFVDATKDLQEKYQPGRFDPEESARLMEKAGFKKNADNLWEKDGKTVSFPIYAFEGTNTETLPVVVEQLRAAGFDASIDVGPDAYQNMVDGKPGAYMFGHGASLVDPHAAMDLFTSRYSAPLGQPAPGGHFSRYENPEYDKIVDAMATLAADDPKFMELFRKAIEIYWRDQIEIPLVQYLHRIPYNQTYWTNWPTADNPALGVNGAFWHYTVPLVVLGLKPAQ